MSRTHRMPKRSEFAAASLFAVYLLIAILLFYRLILFEPRSHSLPFDFTGFHLPSAVFLAGELHHHHLPLWDPNVYCGRPFAANIQTQAFYLPRIVSSFVGGFFGVRGVLYALEIEYLAHLYLAGVFTLLLAREFGLDSIAAALSSIVYVCGCYFSSQAEHIGATEAACWLPLAWLGAVLITDGRYAKGLVALTIAVAAAILCGFTPMALILYGSISLLTAMFLLLRSATPRALALVVFGLFCALLIAGIQLLPATQLLSESVARWRSEWMTATGGGLPFRSFATMLAPNYFGVFDLKAYRYAYDPTFLFLYSGVLIVPLVLVGCLAVRARRYVPIVLMLCFCALLMCGDNTPVGIWLYRILPRILRETYYPQHWMAPFSLCLGLIAGMGLQYITKRPAILVAVLLFVTADLLYVSAGRPLNTANLGTDPLIDERSFEGDASILGKVQELSHQDFPPSRLDTINDSLLWSQSAPITGVPSANGYDPMALSRLIQVRLGFAHGERWGAFYEVQNPASVVVSLLNVKLLWSRTQLPTEVSQAAGIELAGTFPGRFLYRNVHELPRFFLTSRVSVAPTFEEAAKWMRRPDWQPGNEAVIETSGVEHSPTLEGGPVGQVRMLRYEPNRVDVRTQTQSEELLVSSETNYPGWKAFVDGTERPVLYTDVAFRGVFIPAGNHLVSFRFEPVIFVYGAVVTLLGLWLLCATAYSLSKPAR